MARRPNAPAAPTVPGQRPQGQNRTDAERETDLVLLAKLYLMGISQKDMAREIGVTPAQIYYDLQECHRRWAAQGAAFIEQGKAKCLASLDWVESEATGAWYISQGRKKEVTSTTAGRNPGRTVKQWHEAGDPRFLTIIKETVAQRCQILGLNAPLKAELLIEDMTEEDYQSKLKAAGIDDSPRWGRVLMDN